LLTKATTLISNKIIEQFVSTLIQLLINSIEKVSKIIQLLSATTLISKVDSPMFFLMVSLLHQQKIHLLENSLKALKMAFEHSKSSQAI
jgi:hypothetical protein